MPGTEGYPRPVPAGVDQVVLFELIDLVLDLLIIALLIAMVIGWRDIAENP